MVNTEVGTVLEFSIIAKVLLRTVTTVKTRVVSSGKNFPKFIVIFGMFYSMCRHRSSSLRPKA